MVVKMSNVLIVRYGWPEAANIRSGRARSFGIIDVKIFMRFIGLLLKRLSSSEGNSISIITIRSNWCQERAFNRR